MKVFLANVSIVFVYFTVTMSETGSVKAVFNRILDSLVLPGNSENDPSDREEDLLRSRRTRARLSVSSAGLGRNDAVARDFEAELEDQESLLVVIENLSENLDDLKNAEPVQLF